MGIGAGGVKGAKTPLVSGVIWLLRLSYSRARRPRRSSSVPASSDTYVDAGEPTRNFDADTRLNVDKSPQRIAYLRFQVTGVGTRRVVGARLSSMRPPAAR
jgi:hypothetical protein